MPVAFSRITNCNQSRSAGEYSLCPALLRPIGRSSPACS